MKGIKAFTRKGECKKKKKKKKKEKKKKHHLFNFGNERIIKIQTWSIL